VLYSAFLLFGIYKEGLNSDCQQIHQYQQNEQFPLNSFNIKRILHMMLDIQVLEQAQKCDSDKPINGILCCLI